MNNSLSPRKRTSKKFCSIYCRSIALFLCRRSLNKVCSCSYRYSNAFSLDGWRSPMVARIFGLEEYIGATEQEGLGGGISLCKEVTALGVRTKALKNAQYGICNVSCSGSKLCHVSASYRAGRRRVRWGTKKLWSLFLLFLNLWHFFTRCLPQRKCLGVASDQVSRRRR